MNALAVNAERQPLLDENGHQIFYQVGMYSNINKTASCCI